MTEIVKKNQELYGHHAKNLIPIKHLMLIGPEIRLNYQKCYINIRKLAYCHKQLFEILENSELPTENIFEKYKLLWKFEKQVS